MERAHERLHPHRRRQPQEPDTGGRPQGYIWALPSINGFRRTLAQTLPDEQRLAEQLRDAQQPRRAGQVMGLFGPDVPNATLLEISWYVSACGNHVPWGWFNLVANASKAAVDNTGERGQLMMAYERGKRKELGHLQGIARLLTHKSCTEKLRKWVRAALLLATGMCRAKMDLVFFTGHEWEHMGGYVQKDSGKAHYRFFAYPGMYVCTLYVCCFRTRTHRTQSIFCLRWRLAPRSASRSAPRSVGKRISPLCATHTKSKATAYPSTNQHWRLATFVMKRSSSTVSTSAPLSALRYPRFATLFSGPSLAVD